MKKKYITSLILSFLIFLPPLILHQNMPKDEQWSALDWMNLFYLIAFVESGILFFIFSQYTNEKQEDKRKEANHSQNIANALEIMKDGEFGKYSNKMEFLVPYPHSEYKDDNRKTVYPTMDELNKFAFDYLNRETTSDNERKSYGFVPLSQSPEAKFEWVMEHLQSYKDIKQKLDNAETAQTEYNNFYIENNSELVKYSDGYESSNHEAKTLIDNVNKKIEESNNSMHELRKAFEKLYYELKDGGTVKGKCHICK